MHTLTIFPDGDLAFEPLGVRKISIDHVADLKSYSISRVHERIMHVMEFQNGGMCEITYVLQQDGAALLEMLYGSQVVMKLFPDNHVVVASSEKQAPRPFAMRP
jgi:hypothetical protein